MLKDTLRFSLRKGYIGVFFVLSLAVSGAGDARAAFLGDRLKPFASVSEMYDSNIFRVKDKDQLLALVGDTQLSDLITIASIGTGFNYTIGVQELNLLLKRDFIRFSHYSSQDSDRDELSGNIALRLLDRVKIRIDGGYTKEPEPREDFRTAALNEKTNIQYGLSAGYDFKSGIGVEGAWRRVQTTYSLPEFGANEHDLDRYSGTISYTISPTGKVYATYQREDRAYKGALVAGSTTVKRDNTADSVRVGFIKSYSAKTTFSGYVGYTDRRYDQLSSRDFSGLIGRADVSYAATSKIMVIMNWERDLYEETYTDRIYSVNDIVGAGVAYQISEKMKATITNQLTWKDFRDLPGSGATRRNDFLYDVGAGVEWTPINRLTFNIGYKHSTRSSSDHTFDFSSDAVTAGVAYRF